MIFTILGLFLYILGIFWTIGHSRKPSSSCKEYEGAYHEGGDNWHWPVATPHKLRIRKFYFVFTLTSVIDKLI